MKRKEKKYFLKQSLFILSTVALLGGQTNNVKAAEEKQTEQEYRKEYQIEENIPLLDLTSYRFRFIKLENNNKSKYYFCVENNTYLEETVSQDHVIKLFENTPSEDLINSNSLKYVKKPTVTTSEYIDIFNAKNKFYIHTIMINVFDNIPSDQNAKLVYWGDIKTFSSTISDEVYTEYYSFDVATQQLTINYDVEPQCKISCEYVNAVLDKLYSASYISEEQLEYVLDILNEEIPMLTKKK